jgi:hypothetical protein
MTCFKGLSKVEWCFFFFLIKEDVKKKGLTFATKKELQTQKPTIGNLLVVLQKK